MKSNKRAVDLGTRRCRGKKWEGVVGVKVVVWMYCMREGNMTRKINFHELQ